ncbi:MAG: YbaY family lipoprotein [Gemmatimonadota bacterium]
MTNATERVEGTAGYRERIMPPPGSELVVSLQDVSRADAPAVVLAEQRIAVEGGPPWGFSLEYDPAQVEDRGRYTVRVRLEREGRLLFTSTEHVPPFDRSPDDPIRIQLTRVGGDRAEPPVPDASLVDTYWKLTELNGEPASLGAGDREVHMVLTSEMEARGFAGCNRFTGSWERDGNDVRFGPLAATQRACAEGMDLERRFLDALEATRRSAIAGDTLSLFSGDERLVLRFAAVYLE